VAAGIELVVVSMGREGACFVTATDALIARPPDIEVRSTVGAGDAMAAGIVAAQIRGLPLDACARLASAFSLQHLLTVSRASPSKAACEEAIERITIEKGAAKPRMNGTAPGCPRSSAPRSPQRPASARPRTKSSPRSVKRHVTSPQGNAFG
jgi:hypothetical protein